MSEPILYVPGHADFLLHICFFISVTGTVDNLMLHVGSKFSLLHTDFFSIDQMSQLGGLAPHLPKCTLVISCTNNYFAVWKWYR